MQHKELKQQKIDELIPYARNSRTHSDEQIAQIASSIREFGWTNPVLVDKNNTIIAGHGRVLGARRLGLEQVPTICLDHLTEAQVRAYVIADNKLALNAGWDDELLKSELENLKAEGYELGIVGFTEQELEELNAFAEENKETEAVKYSTELDQQSNYVVLKFSKDIDWIQAETLLGIESTYSRRQNGKTWSKGVGRVLEGTKAISKLAGVQEADPYLIALEIDKEYSDKPEADKDEIAKSFLTRAGLKKFEYIKSPTGKKVVILAGGYAFGFTSSREIRMQEMIADRLGDAYVPTYYFGSRVLVQSRCITGDITEEENEKHASLAKKKNITDVTKRNMGRIGAKVYVFDAVDDEAKHPKA
jgi:hypothetical protein